MKNSKITACFLSFILVFSLVIPVNAANAESANPKESVNTNINDVLTSSEAEKLISILEELDRTLNMNNLSENTDEMLNKLSSDARDFYNVYKESESLAFNNYINFESTSTNIVSNTTNQEVTTMKAASVGLGTFTVITQSQINKINTLAKELGIGYSFVVATASVFKKIQLH